MRIYIEAPNEYTKLGRCQRAVLDKSNAHRLVELGVHTVTIFGRTLFVSELVLEMAYSEFNKWPEINGHHNFHISAVDIALGRD